MDIKNNKYIITGDIEDTIIKKRRARSNFASIGAIFDKAGEILKEYTKNNITQNSGIGISLINWNNKQYLSWLFDN